MGVSGCSVEHGGDCDIVITCETVSHSALSLHVYTDNNAVGYLKERKWPAMPN